MLPPLQSLYHQKSLTNKSKCWNAGLCIKKSKSGYQWQHITIEMIHQMNCEHMDTEIVYTHQHVNPSEVGSWVQRCPWTCYDAWPSDRPCMTLHTLIISQDTCTDFLKDSHFTMTASKGGIWRRFLSNRPDIRTGIRPMAVFRMFWIYVI